MDRPRVTVHSLVSLDGRLDGFPPDVGLYYELARALPHQAVLTGSGTLLAAAAHEGVDLTVEDDEVPPAPAADDRPLLAIVDSAGRITRFAWLRDVPFWRDILVLCSSATPDPHRRRLRRLGLDHLVTVGERVDLAEALRVLHVRYAVEAVRVDAGGTLTGALVRAGLVDEISVIVAPYLVGTAPARPLPVVAGLDGDAAARLDLVSAAAQRDGHVWLRYAARPR